MDFRQIAGMLLVHREADTGTCGWVLLRVGGEGRAQGAAKGQALQRLDVRVAMHADLLAPPESWICQRAYAGPCGGKLWVQCAHFDNSCKGRCQLLQP